MTDEIKRLIEDQGKAFDAFKCTMDEMKSADALTEEKLARIEKVLDDAVEAKAAIERRLEVERKEREALELRLSRPGGGGEIDPRSHEVKMMNAVLSANTRGGRAPAAIDANGLTAYKEAQNRYIREGVDGLDTAERKTLAVGSDPDGGYFVTPDLGGRIVTRVYETSPWRSIASIQQINTDALEGIEDLDETGAGYGGEKTLSGSAETPQVGKWRIPVYWIDTEPKTTQQLLDDALVDIEGWLSAKVADKFSRFENREFTIGAANIRGITSYTTAIDSGAGVAWGTIGHVNTGQNGGFATSNPADKLFDLVGALKEAYLSNARFLTKRSVITEIRKFKAPDGVFGHYLWQPSLQMGQPETLMGYPITRAEDLPTLGTGSLSLYFGDFRAAYQIVDRAGIRVLRDNLTSKPFVKFYTTKRVGGGVVNFEAVKALRFAGS